RRRRRLLSSTDRHRSQRLDPRRHPPARRPARRARRAVGGAALRGAPGGATAHPRGARAGALRGVRRANAGDARAANGAAALLEAQSAWPRRVDGAAVHAGRAHVDHGARVRARRAPRAAHAAAAWRRAPAAGRAHARGPRAVGLDPAPRRRRAARPAVVRRAAVAVVCLRRTLDHALLERARALGVDFRPGVTVQALRTEGERVAGVVGRDGREIAARFTLVADGAHSRLAVDTRPPRTLQAIMGWWEGAPFRGHHVEMVFDRLVTPDRKSTRLN